MTKKPKSPKRTPIATIKGYLPIRLSLPPLHNTPLFTTYIYIKEHISKNASSSILFVANAPSNGPIRTDVFLRAIFERYVPVERVTVASDPRKASEEGVTDTDATLFRVTSFDGGMAQKNERGDGKFAHVVFSSRQEMKKAIKAIREDVETNEILRLDDDTIDALVQETQVLRRQLVNQGSEVNEDEASNIKPLTGIHAVVQQYEQSAYRHMSRQQLMEKCNTIMSAYEQSELAAQENAKRATEQPDEDGFITVTHGSSTPSFLDDELETTQHQVGRGKGSKRTRKRKADNRSGAGEFADFYKFQWKEMKKKEMSDLKARFEEDLEKVKKMKEERAFRPF